MSSRPFARGILFDVLFWVLLAGVVVAQVAVIAPEFWATRLWEDEAFNLIVPQNLITGHGYSSSGLLSTGVRTPFDVRVSTGPVMLLPVAAVLSTGIDPVIGGRLVSLVFYAGLLTALWLLGRRIAGRWAALLAVAAPLALNTNQLPSPVQGPLDILGEFPAAALIAWAFVCTRRRPWLGGLILGLAIQTKFISVLAAPALLVYLWFLLAGEPWRARLRRCAWFVGCAAAPTGAYWLAVLVSLGPAGFVTNLHEFIRFLRTGGQVAAVPPDQKLIGLVGSWFVDSWIAIAVVVASIVIGAMAVVSYLAARRAHVPLHGLGHEAGAQTSDRDVALLLVAVAINLVTWAGWWTVSRGTPTWIRYPAVGLLVSIPVLAAGAVLGVRMLWLRAGGSDGLGRRKALRWTSAVVAAVLCAAIAASTAVSVQRHVSAATVADYGETLSQQRQVARRLASLGDEKFATPWGSQLGAILLSRVPFTSLTGPGAAHLPIVLWTPDPTPEGQAAFSALVESTCKRDVVRVAPAYVVCRTR